MRKSTVIAAGTPISSFVTPKFTGDLASNYSFYGNTSAMMIQTKGGVKFEVKTTAKINVTGISMNLTKVNNAFIFISTPSETYNMRVCSNYLFISMYMTFSFEIKRSFYIQWFVINIGTILIYSIFYV